MGATARSAAFTAVLLMLPVAAALLLYRSALGLGWCCDDTQILWQAVRHSPAQYLFEPAAWRSLSAAFFTPWVTLSYELDLALFGFTPFGFQLHHLLALGACASLLWLLARQWTNSHFAAAAPLLFLVSVPIAQASHTLMVRHYLEGLACCLAALLLVTAQLRGGPRRLGLLAGLCFAGAVMSKEVFVPLGLLPLLLPLADWRARLRAAWPWLLVLALYLPWRWFMLGDPVGGYTPRGEQAAVDGGLVWRQLAGAPGLLWTWPLMGAGAWLTALALGTALALRSATTAARWQVTAGLLGLAVFLFAPLWPLLRIGGLATGNERLLIAPGAAAALLAAVALGRLAPAGAPKRHRAVASALLLAMAAAAWPAVDAALQRARALHARDGALRDLLLRETPPTVVLPPEEAADHFIQGLIALRPAMGLAAAAPRVAADELELAALSAGTGAVLEVSPGGTVSDVTPQLPARLAAWRGRMAQQPWRVSLERQPRQQTVRWSFETAGATRFVLLAPGRRIPVPAPAAAWRLAHPLPPCFRIRAELEGGRIAYTPPLALSAPDADGAQHLRWSGSADRPAAPAASFGC